MMDDMKTVENMLFAYPVIVSEIRILDLEIERVENDYHGTSSHRKYDEKVQESKKTESVIENLLIKKESELETLRRTKRELEIEAEKTDSLLKILSDTEYLFVTTYYFKKKGAKRTAEVMEVSQNYVYKIRHRVLKERLCPECIVK